MHTAITPLPLANSVNRMQQLCTAVEWQFFLKQSRLIIEKYHAVHLLLGGHEDPILNFCFAQGKIKQVSTFQRLQHKTFFQ